MKSGGEAKWLVVYLSDSRDRAENAARLLADEGFLVRGDVPGGPVSHSEMYELRVLQAEAQEARQLLIENGF